MKADSTQSNLRQRWFDGLLLTLVAIMPFHAFLVTWLGTSFGHETLFQAWKEIVLVILVILGVTLFKLDRIQQQLRRPLNLAIVAFAVLALVVSLATGIWHHSAFWYGLKTDLEFLLAFILAQFASPKIRRLAVATLLVAATIVAIFGVLQVTVLPADFLTHFGYGPTTIEPYAYVNPAVSAIRILSTLGGPNQLGSFLILPICLTVYRLIKDRQLLWLLPLAASTFTLWYSYSRSAELGLLVSLAVMLFMVLRMRNRLIMIGLVAIAIIAISILSQSALRNSKALQAYVFHGSLINNQVFGSDAAHFDQVQAGIHAILKQPLGRGLGTAGPASYHGSNGIITEDYYLQIGIEAGIIGLLLFLAITILTGIELVQAGSVGLPIFGALVGLAVCNLFLHTWADSSTALTFWTVAGLTIKERHGRA